MPYNSRVQRSVSTGLVGAPQGSLSICAGWPRCRGEMVRNAVVFNINLILERIKFSQ